MAKFITNYKSDLPSGWEEKVSPEGRVYYLDHTTKETQWNHPITKKRKRVVAGLPPGWTQIEEKNGQTKFINKSKNITTNTDPRLPLVLEEKEYHEDTNPTEVVPYPFQLQMLSYNLALVNPYLLNQLLPNPFAKVPVLPSLLPPGNNTKNPSDIKGLSNNNTSMFPTRSSQGFGDLSSGSIPSLMSKNCPDKGFSPVTGPAKGSVPDKPIVKPSRFGSVGNNQLGRTRKSRFDSGPLPSNNQPDIGFKGELSKAPTSRFDAGLPDKGAGNNSNPQSWFGPGRNNQPDRGFKGELSKAPTSRFDAGLPDKGAGNNSNPQSWFGPGRNNQPDRGFKDSTYPNSRFERFDTGSQNEDAEKVSYRYSRFGPQLGERNHSDRDFQNDSAQNPISRFGPGPAGISNMSNKSFNVESDSNPYSRFDHREEERYNPHDRNFQDKYRMDPHLRLGPGFQGKNTSLDRDFNNEFESKPYSRFDTHEEERNNPIGRGLPNESGLDRHSRFGSGPPDRNYSAGRSFNDGPSSSSYSRFDSRERERYTPKGKGGRDDFDSKPYLKFGDRETQIGRSFRGDDFDSPAYSRFGPREREKSSPPGRNYKYEDDSPPYSRFGSRIEPDRGLREIPRSNSKSRFGPSSSDRDFLPGRGSRNESASYTGSRFQYGSREREYSPDRRMQQFHGRPEEKDSRGSASREFSPQRQGYSYESFEAGHRKRIYDSDPNERGYSPKRRHYDNFNMPGSSEREYNTYDERRYAEPQGHYSERLDKSRRIGGRFYSDQDMEREHRMQEPKYFDDEPRDYPQSGFPTEENEFLDRMNSPDAPVEDNQDRNMGEDDSENTAASNDSENSDGNEDDKDEYGEFQDDNNMVDGPEATKKKKPFKKENVIVQKRNVVAIVPEGYPRIESLSRIQAEETKHLIVKQIELLKPEDGVSPRFSGTFYKVGALMVTCLDQQTRNWLEKILSQIVLSNGTNVRIRGPRIVRGTAIISGLFPGKYEGEERFLHILTACNPRIDISRWTVVEQFNVNGSTCVSIGTPKSTIWELEQVKYIMYYNDRSLKVRVVSKKNSGKRPQRGKLRQALQDALTDVREGIH